MTIEAIAILRNRDILRLQEIHARGAWIYAKKTIASEVTMSTTTVNDLVFVLATHDAIAAFLGTLESPNTLMTYRKALKQFEKIAPLDLASLDESSLFAFNNALADKSKGTKDTYISAVLSFFGYLSLTRLNEKVNLTRAQLIKRKLGVRLGKRISNYSAPHLKVLYEYAKDNLRLKRIGSPWQTLLALRDRALILTLAETGLRRAELASLKLHDVDFEEGQAVVIGKGNKQGVVYFGEYSLQSIRDYIEARANKDHDSPLFMRHDKAKGKDPNKHITTHAIFLAVQQRAREALRRDDVKISPHALRHYFVTAILKSTSNLMLAKELARHDSVVTTQRYAHVENEELRSAHAQVFGSSTNDTPERKQDDGQTIYSPVGTDNPGAGKSQENQEAGL